MKKVLFILLMGAAVTIFLISNSANAGQEKVIYVSINGNDQNDGTKLKPFRTLNKAATKASAGTTVFIRKGTYNEKLVVKHSGTKTKPITFKAYKNEKVVVSGKDLKDAEENTSLVTINNKNYVTVSGLIIQDLTSNVTNETVMGIYVTGSSSHITLENNHVQRIETHANDGNGHGIAVYGTSPMVDINILNNTVEDLKLGSSESIVLNGNINGFKIEHNLVRRNDNIGIDIIGYEGISNDKKNDYARNGFIKNNQVYDISSYGNPSYGEDYSAGGIYVDGGKNITIEKNTIYHCDIGIEATSEHAGKYAEHITIRNNIIYENYYTGISIGGYDKERGGTKNSIISKNIIYRNDTKGLDGGQLLLQHNIKKNVIEKNILTAGPSRLFIANHFTTNYANKLIMNVFHKEVGRTGIWVWKEEAYTSFPEFKITSKSDLKSSYLDPKYENENQYNFNLKKDSPAKNIVEN
ncbi:MAG: right-handed parallel beta-helix repeat-containing protein [Bacillota bacterium]|uniref:right-handed parallel beta-helix repeat-containing protein n=1 Tax=unclassified Virgibacillus TaxID=2620237 RepID=UPI000EF52D4F|nr:MULTISPECIES: right-handed parallel beta-helix repeat-containing protein [unclassified Virgibacillus]MCC2248528.1 right-handed parallel beta-helix repeat-containing protein [Virgibacillus sp. AGTR]MDY7043037.1 right-handed parallel beta-helix repeat-containing protein [Virgibacillus sp. M23]QRZ16611.1 right-handed parallel beta-helix repeat-containing protein [Virgibacillus sp. AGTR]